MVTIVENAPTNTNTLQPGKFKFVIPSLPEISFFAVMISFPGVSVSAAQVSTPFSDTWRAGDKVMFDPLTVTFNVDEDMRNWESAFRWVTGLTYPHDYKEYRDQKKKYISRDAQLILLTNSNVDNILFTLTNCVPISLGPIIFSTTDDANVTPTCDFTLQFDLVEMSRFS